jgi:hypothetical protein
VPVHGPQGLTTMSIVRGRLRLHNKGTEGCSEYAKAVGDGWVNYSLCWIGL